MQYEETRVAGAKTRAKTALAKAGRAFNGEPAPRETAITELHRRAVLDSADMIEPHLASASLISTHAGIQAFTADRLATMSAGLFLEFGFHVGHSAQVFASALQQRPDRATLYSFDAFKGLRDNWSQIDHTKGAFDLGGRTPEAPPGVELVVGWLEDTLAAFLADHEGCVSFCHFDLDVYEPTAFGLATLKPRLASGSLILFDELHGYPGWRNYEWRALNETLDPDEYEFVAFGPEQALVEFTGGATSVARHHE